MIFIKPIRILKLWAIKNHLSDLKTKILRLKIIQESQ